MNESRGSESLSAVFLDLDGVVLDVSQRYFRLHQDIIGAIGGDAITEETFWDLKRDATPIEEIAGLSKDQAKEYWKRWNTLIEAPAYLELDRYLPQARLAIKLLTSDYAIVIVALRRRASALREQLKSLDFPKVSQILATMPRSNPDESKASLIRTSPYFSRTSVIVGDTDVDIRAGQLLGVTTIAVQGGLRSQELLARQAPDVMIEGIRELPSALRQLFTGGRP